MRNPDPKSTNPDPNHRSAFARRFLEYFDAVDPPPETFAALAAGPWQVRSTPDGSWGCYAPGVAEPEITLHQRHLALLAAAALPVAVPQRRFKFKEGVYRPCVILDDGEESGTASWAYQEFLTTLNSFADLASSPVSLAYLLEAVGNPVLDRTGLVLGEHVRARGDLA